MNSLFALLAVALAAEAAPLIAEDASNHLEVLFINDFTLNFVADGAGAKRASKISKSIACRMNAYPEAAAQFDFTSSVVDSIDASIDLTLQYDFYDGGRFNFINGRTMTRDGFAAEAGLLFKDFCADGPKESDLPYYVDTVLDNAQNVDVLVLFTAAPSAELAAALPLDTKQFKAVIIVGLNGADATAFYPDSSLTIADFAHPETIACLINTAFTNIQQRKAESLTKTCVN